VVALILGLFSKALIASSLFFPIRIGSTVLKCQKLCIRLVVVSARIFILEKQNVDCMTEKLNILKTLVIRELKPTLNDKVSSEKLYLY